MRVDTIIGWTALAMAQGTASLGGSRVAFFGGSFDPPHRGHIAIARAAQRALRLDAVLFAPVGAQPLKPSGSTADFDDRVAMTRLAIADEPDFALSLVDAPTPSHAPNYTVDTLHSLRAQLPAGGTLFCLIGADSFRNLGLWHRGAEIPFVAPLIVASRPGQSLADLASVLPAGLSLVEQAASTTGTGAEALATFTLRNAAGSSAPFYLLPGLHIDISATEIRCQVRAAAESNDAPPDLAPSVAAFIATHGLYR